MCSKLIGGILFHRYSVAVEIIKEAVRLNLEVDGVEAFTVKGLTVQPHMEYSFISPDISDCGVLGKLNLEFLHKQKDRDFWYEVLVDDPEYLIEQNDDRNYINLQTGKPGGVWRYFKD